MTLKALGAARPSCPVCLRTLEHARNALIAMSHRGAPSLCGQIVEEVMHSTADQTDFVAADSFEAAAKDAVPA